MDRWARACTHTHTHTHTQRRYKMKETGRKKRQFQARTRFLAFLITNIFPLIYVSVSLDNSVLFSWDAVNVIFMGQSWA
jgi:hypothetical protein